MSTDVTLPALGESVTEGTVTRWLKQVGDSIAVDEPLLEVSTDKVDTEIPSPVQGTVLEIKVAEDETVEVGTVLATVGTEAGAEGDGGGAAPASDQAAEAPAEPAADSRPAPPPTAGSIAAAADGAQAPAASEPEAEAPAEPAAAPAPAAAQAGGQGTDVRLPELGESVTEGTVTRWLKQVGDSIAVDEPLLEISTDKVDTEIPSPVAGTVLDIKVAEDETVEVGAVLAVVGAGEGAPAEASAPAPATTPTAQTTAPSESAPAPSTTTPAPSAPAPSQPTPAPAPSQPAAAAPAAASTPAAAPSRPGGSPYITPLVRKLAAQHDVDLSTVNGTGVGGRIRKQDVIQAAEAKKAAPPEPEPTPAASAPAAAPAPAEVSPLRGTTQKMTRLRKVIATRMVESLQTAAQLTTVVEVDVTSVARLRNRVKDSFVQREGVKLSFLPFFAKASVEALKTYPQLNAAIDTEAGEITYHPAEHLGIAIDTERGLLVATVKDAGDLSIAGLARKIADVADRTRNNKISPDELTGATFTLTNTGSRGALFDTPIIFQPQVAILGTGAVVKRPVVIDDPNLGETIAVRHMVYLALTYDHRLVDGADAARFLTAVKQRLEGANFGAELGL
ncbi:MAG TPA: 2-oxoglutarate dehydrogenase, E2 component, dihydrolipoamide succinyltransferase [Nocardioidaceae bacterium]|nr:2-oxoglutarate dehydrogenase, E2 component, dihydrolipoamide succinyltransferase [Nocardioidaceae bacterium]